MEINMKSSLNIANIHQILIDQILSNDIIILILSTKTN